VREIDGLPKQEPGELSADYVARLTLDELRRLGVAQASEGASRSEEPGSRNPYRSASYGRLRYLQWVQLIDDEIARRKRCNPPTEGHAGHNYL
jgi:hypothetical protein